MGVAVIAFSTGAFAQSNSSYTSQQGLRNTVDVDQSGNGNRAGLSADQVIYQSNDSMSTGNSLVIKQSGANNIIGQADVYGSVVDANQTGSSNTLRLDQSGNSNNIAYRQFGNNNGTRSAEGAPVGNRKFQEQDNYGKSSGNATGLWNYVGQAGNGGNVRLDQESRGSSSSNGVIAFQSGSSGAQYIRLKQTTTSSSSAGADNLAYLDQRTSGTNVIADITQANNGGFYNLTDIRQNGSNVRVTGSQTGSGLDLFVQQTGNNNTVDSIQNADNSQIRVIQNNTGGGNNSVAAFQAGIDHILDVKQVGYGHQVTSTQSDTGQIAMIDQNGFNNTYVGVQSGMMNYASVLQGSNNNIAVVTQAGTSNSALITQNRTR